MLSFPRRRKSLIAAAAVSSVLGAASPAWAKGPSLSARAVLVLGNESGKEYISRRADELRPLASLTKLMAALLVMERKLDLDGTTVINREDWKVALRGARSRLELKWTYRNRDLLYAALLSSDNRATSALGRAVGLNANALVQAMNEKARRMGLKQTTFKGPVGIHHGNRSTAREVARLVRAASRDKVLSKIMGTAGRRIKPRRGYIKPYYRNTNRLVGKSKKYRFLATKTGYNSAAGYCIAVVVKIRGRGGYTVVLLGSRSKWLRIRDLRRVVHWLKSGQLR